MKIADEQSDAIELIKDIKKEMEIMRSLISELEYVTYKCDDRCQIVFFDKDERRVQDC